MIKMFARQWRRAVTLGSALALTSLILPGLASVASADPGIAPIGPEPSTNVNGVKCVQLALGVDVDGQFGQRTYDAVRAFQAGYGLVVDGSVGAATGDKLVPKLASGCLHYVPTTFSDQDSVPTPTLPPDQPPDLSYVALGDSYASGEGAPPFDRTTDLPSNMCHRSLASGATIFSRTLTDAAHGSLSFKNKACSGAATQDAIKGFPDNHQGSQLEALSATTRVVTISIGGNDVGFEPILEGCIKAHALHVLACRDTMKGDVQKKLDKLTMPEDPTNLESLYKAILDRTKGPDGKPQARLFVLGYPHLFPKGLQFSACYGIGPLDQAWINDVTDDGDAIIKKSAEDAGAVFLDLRPTFEGHSSCAGRGKNWINGVRFSSGAGITNFDISPESFHPNAKGQQEIARILQNSYNRAGD